MNEGLPVSLAFFLLLAASVPGTADAPKVPPVAAYFHGLVNSYRESLGLEPYGWDPALAGMARSHAEEMARAGAIFHSKPPSFAVTHGWAENVAFGPALPDDGTEARLLFFLLVSDPPHRRNILLRDWRVEADWVVDKNGYAFLSEEIAKTPVSGFERLRVSPPGPPENCSVVTVRDDRARELERALVARLKALRPGVKVVVDSVPDGALRRDLRLLVPYPVGNTLVVFTRMTWYEPSGPVREDPGKVADDVVRCLLRTPYGVRLLTSSSVKVIHVEVLSVPEIKLPGMIVDTGGVLAVGITLEGASASSGSSPPGHGPVPVVPFVPPPFGFSSRRGSNGVNTRSRGVKVVQEEGSQAAG
ncbi:MAG: CAP domain-containing protein [Methanopyri archaeon]|nr:CAP domain-containing protein [Methanopyri archaeon]